MFDIKRSPNETETQYIWRICSAKDIGTLDITWDEVANILNKELRDEGEYYTSSAYRKKYQQAKLFKDEVFSKETNAEAEQQYLEQKRELERLKIAYRDQRNSWQRDNYITSRIEQDLDYLKEQLQTIGRKEFVVFDYVDTESDKDLIVCLSDLHAGQTFSNSFGKYNTDIMKERLEMYLDKAIEIIQKENVQDVYIACLGDLISSNIRLSIQVSNRENIIEQVKISAETIANFCMTLAEYCHHVYLYSVAGNHSRLVSQKDLDVKDERLDSLIAWIVKQIVDLPNNNITVNLDNLDTTVAEMVVRGKSYILTHGDYNASTPGDVGKLSLLLGKIPYAILNGHLHTPAFSEINGVKCIQSASLVGNGDDYTIQKRLCGTPSQTIMTVDENGIDGIWHVDLS